MATAIEMVLAALDEAYEKKSWHGTNLRGALRRVSAEEALWRPAVGRLNIWELAVHAAYWKYAVRRRLRGDKRGSFPLKGSNFFPSPSRADEGEWREALAILSGIISRHGIDVAITGDPFGALRMLRMEAYDLVVYDVSSETVDHDLMLQTLQRDLPVVLGRTILVTRTPFESSRIPAGVPMIDS